MVLDMVALDTLKSHMVFNFFLAGQTNDDAYIPEVNSQSRKLCARARHTQALS